MTSRFRGPAAIAVLILIGALALPVSTRADGSAGQIAFARLLESGGADVFVASPDGSAATLVSLGDVAEDYGIPVWSPDASHLLVSHVLRFDGNGELLPFRPAIVHPDGSDYTRLAMPDAPFDMDCPTWSIDASRILCAFGGEAPGVFSVRASDGGDTVRLTTSPAGGNDVPTDVSPDGSRFVFVRFRPGPMPGPRPFQTQQVGLFVANMNGTGIRQIVPYGVALGHERIGAHWSPDGRSVISATKNGRLFVAAVDGSRISQIQLEIGTSRYFAFEPGWSPDGSRIVFAMFVDGQTDLYTANPDGSDVARITNTPEIENGPDWGAAR